jgi:hypothetical protein
MINHVCSLQYSILDLLVVIYSICRHIYIFFFFSRIKHFDLYFSEMFTLVAGFSVIKMFCSPFCIVLGKHLHFVVQYELYLY